MTSVDRIQGLSGSIAVKTPCRVATTANITLSGEQTIDAVAVVDGDRVLVKNQTDTTENGIYNVSTGHWTRALDFDGANDFVQGTLVPIASGTANGLVVFQLTTAAPAIGVTALAFAPSVSFGIGLVDSSTGTVVSLSGTAAAPVAKISESGFPSYSGAEPAGPFRVYAAAAEGTGKIAGSFIITNGAAIPFNTLGTGDSCAVSGWGYRDTGGTNPMVVANFGARIENNLGAITWGVEVDINNEGATQSINDPAGGEAIVINTGSTYSPSTGLRIRRATGEGTGPGYLRGIMIDGAREQAITCVAMEASTYPGMSPAAPGTLNILTSYKSADTDVRFQMNESGTMTWGDGTNPVDTTLARAASGGLNLTGPFQTNTAFYVGANQVVGARNTGWTAMTGTPDESTAYDTSTVTLPQLAGRVAALQAALTTHGMIGA